MVTRQDLRNTCRQARKCPGETILCGPYRIYYNEITEIYVLKTFGTYSYSSVDGLWRLIKSWRNNHKNVSK